MIYQEKLQIGFHKYIHKRWKEEPAMESQNTDSKDGNLNLSHTEPVINKMVKSNYVLTHPKKEKRTIVATWYLVDGSV